MKTLNDVKADMSSLYDEVRIGKTELKVAAELANIAGKFLKAEQLELARDIFTHGGQLRQLPGADAAAMKRLEAA